MPSSADDALLTTRNGSDEAKNGGIAIKKLWQLKPPELKIDYRYQAEILLAT